jgi:hypothetical protein
MRSTMRLWSQVDTHHTIRSIRASGLRSGQNTAMTIVTTMNVRNTLSKSDNGCHAGTTLRNDRGS